MKFLVLGASGMAGHTICLYLREQGHNVTGFARRELSFVDCIKGDACNRGLLEKVVTQGEYDIVINAIGVLNKAAENDEASAIILNAELPHWLAEFTNNTPTRVFHMSTDCVFAGNTGPYTENSFPDGETIYDRTKAAGELHDSKNLTFRNSIVGPDLNANGIGLFNWFMQQHGSIRGFKGAIWTGLTTLELAQAMEVAAREDVAGLVNMVPESSISKFDLLQIFNTVFRASAIKIVPDSSLLIDKSLVRTNFDCSFRPKSYDAQIAEMHEWVIAHAELYPHYNLGASGGDSEKCSKRRYGCNRKYETNLNRC